MSPFYPQYLFHLKEGMCHTGMFTVALFVIAQSETTQSVLHSGKFIKWNTTQQWKGSELDTHNNMEKPEKNYAKWNNSDKKHA